MAAATTETAKRRLHVVTGGEASAEPDEARRFHGMLGVSSAMREVFRLARRAARFDYPVVLTGESGTGKDLLAQAIHAESRRCAGPFVPVNCGALPENLVESELFGHVRGAFSGAVANRKGRFELAHGGTLFLDEVGELTSAAQVKLLRVLETQQFEPVGGEQTIAVDVRILCATNRDLRQMVDDGEFREDLFYRLRVVPVQLPALRERRADIPVLVRSFIADIAGETEQPFLDVSRESMDALLAHRWPGNVRELISALRYAALTCGGGTILAGHLPSDIHDGPRRPLASAAPLTMPREPLLTPTAQRTELTAELVASALSDAGGNKTLAAQLLGVGRATLYRFLARSQVS